MRGFAKITLYSIIITIAMFVFTSFIYFFPWYTTLVVETFNISQIVAGDNYLKQSYKDDTLTRLENKPLFRENPSAIKITVENEDGTEAVGDDDETIYETSVDIDKPYRQRGNTIYVKLEASYPLKVKVWGTTYKKDIDVSFEMKTVGLKHYKDLDYYFG